MITDKIEEAQAKLHDADNLVNALQILSTVIQESVFPLHDSRQASQMGAAMAGTATIASVLIVSARDLLEDIEPEEALK